MKRPFGRRTTLLRGLTITMVINHLLYSWDDPPSALGSSIWLHRPHLEISSWRILPKFGSDARTSRGQLQVTGFNGKSSPIGSMGLVFTYILLLFYGKWLGKSTSSMDPMGQGSNKTRWCQRLCSPKNRGT